MYRLCASRDAGLTRLENDLATLLRTTENCVKGARAFVEKPKLGWPGR